MIALAGTVERRLLVNYRLDPGVARTLVPAGLRPQLVDGSAVAGVCLIRLGALRPTWLRPAVGWRGENAAHRIAVEWDDASGIRTGVFISQRHSSSWLPVAIGGRLVPGVHGHASFRVVETRDRITVDFAAPGTTVRADVAVSPTWNSSLFPTLAAASDFFRSGSVGWSPDRHGTGLEGLKLETDRWSVEAGEILGMQSSFFDALPPGSAVLDSVLVMRGVPVTWSSPRPLGAVEREPLQAVTEE